METQECSLCHRQAAWLIGTERFCEGHKERIIEDVGVDRFPIRRLTESEPAFRGGGHFSRSTTKRKERGDKTNGKNC
jgi:hypothetical protein